MADIKDTEDEALDPALGGVVRDPDSVSTPVVEDDDGDEDEADTDEGDSDTALNDAKTADETADADAKGKDSSGIER
jgi:hypothetical protein